ncbi:MAG: hypothetical protein K0S65_2082 [Labilithrix sp.]|nr:hypothetical protein [Labilithrix sp.]
MTDHSHGSLPGELARLVAAERQRGPAPTEAENEVLANLEAILGGGGGSPPPGDATPSNRGLLQRLGRFATSRAAVAIGAFVTGAAAGALIRGTAPKEVVYVDRPIPAVAPVATASASPALPLPLPTVSVALLPKAPARLAPAPPSVPAREDRTGPVHDTSLAAERAIVETGRMALARGDHASAFDALNRHASSFPDGQLAEEREVLAIQTLVAAHRAREAIERGAKFRLQHPESVLLPVVDEMLR